MSPVTALLDAPPARPAAAPRPQVARIYAAYAAAFLVVTLLSGVWLRSVFVAPEAMAGFRFAFALHAHSHVAFFGWTSMALFAIVVARFGRGRLAAGLGLHAHLVGLASAAAFVGFLLLGYAPLTIALSSLHVALWLVFALAAWTWLDDAAPLERLYWRGALAFLVLAGLGAMTPGVVMARQIGDVWLNQLTIKLFLTPFTSGWLALGVMGAAYAATDRRRFAVAAFWLTAAGALPSVLLHTSAAPPAEWMTLVGRAGTVLVGLGALLFAADLLSARAAAPLLRLAGLAAAGKGGAEVLAATGPLLDLIAVRQLAIAYLHLVLLGMVTPVLAAAAFGIDAAPRRTLAYAAGLATMVGSLVVIGWPALGSRAFALGIEPAWLFRSALAGGALCAAAGVALLAAANRGANPAPADAALPAPRTRPAAGAALATR